MTMKISHLKGLLNNMLLAKNKKDLSILDAHLH